MGELVAATPTKVLPLPGCKRGLPSADWMSCSYTRHYVNGTLCVPLAMCAYLEAAGSSTGSTSAAHCQHAEGARGACDDPVACNPTCECSQLTFMNGCPELHVTERRPMCCGRCRAHTSSLARPTTPHAGLWGLPSRSRLYKGEGHPFSCRLEYIHVYAPPIHRRAANNAGACLASLAAAERELLLEGARQLGYQGWEAASSDLPGVTCDESGRVTRL